MNQTQRDVHSLGREELIGNSGDSEGKVVWAIMGGLNCQNQAFELYCVGTAEQLKGLGKNSCCKCYTMIAADKMDSLRCNLEAKKQVWTSLEAIVMR